MTSFSHNQLIDLVEGRLPPAEAAALRARLQADPAALRELAALESLIGLMRSDESVDAPDHVINRALRLMRPPAAPAPSALRRVMAVLRHDSRLAAPAVGLRSEQPVARNLIYSADDRDLDLQMVPNGGLWQLRGQILGPEEAGTVELHRDSSVVSALVDDLGEFVLPPVAAGRYRFVLRQADREVLIDDLDVGR